MGETSILEWLVNFLEVYKLGNIVQVVAGVVEVGLVGRHGVGRVSC